MKKLPQFGLGLILTVIIRVVLNKSWHKLDRFPKLVRFFEENHYLSSTTIISSSVAQEEPIIVVIGLSQHVAVLTVNGK
jgi:hypothetical protein